MNSQDQLTIDMEYASPIAPMRGVLIALAASAVFYAGLSGVVLLVRGVIG